MSIFIVISVQHIKGQTSTGTQDQPNTDYSTMLIFLVRESESEVKMRVFTGPN